MTQRPKTLQGNMKQHPKKGLKIVLNGRTRGKPGTKLTLQGTMTQRPEDFR